MDFMVVEYLVDVKALSNCLDHPAFSTACDPVFSLISENPMSWFKGKPEKGKPEDQYESAFIMMRACQYLT